LVVLVEDLVVVDSFFDGAGFFADAFLLAAALALVVEVVPVTAFLAAPRLAGAVVFLVVVVLDFGLVMVFFGAGFLAVLALGFSGSAFLVLVFLVVEDLGLVVAAFVVFGLDIGLDVDLVVVADLGLVVDLDVGLFSLVAASVDLDLGASLTLPE
jgi:hypothetical protein